MKCPECSHEFPESARACPNCAYRRDTTMFGASTDTDETVRLTWHSIEGDEDIRETIKLEHRKETSLGHINLARRRIVTGKEVAPGVEYDYEIGEQIGQGGAGIVFEARQRAIGRTVALKMIRTPGDTRNREIFLSEAVATGNLEHPNIVPIYDAGRDRFGRPFYVMRNVKGVRWADVIAKHSQEDNVRTLLRICDAAAFAHSRGVIHRDIKPSNVMLGDYGEVYLMDWGLAVAVNKDGRARILDEESACAGTPAYMSPEMASGDVERIGTASDIYLLGAVLFEIITGETPHAGKDVYECLNHAVRNTIVTVPKKGELFGIALRAMASDPRERFGDVKAFQSAIREYRLHRESIRLTEDALAALTGADENYEGYSHALFGLREALKIWEENNRARRLLIETQLAYARTAFKRDDCELAASLLDPDEPEHAHMRTLINDALARRSTERRRMKEVATDLNAAAQAQTSIMERRPLRFDPIDYATVYRTAMEVGGGYIDFDTIDGSRLLAFIADAVGLGVAAALDMVALRTVFKINGADTDGDLLKLLRTVNSDFSNRTLSSGRTVSARVCLFDRRTPRTFTMVSVGEMNCLLYRRTQNGITRVASSAPPLGHPNRKEFSRALRAETVEWAPGDMLFFYSSGVAALLSSTGEVLGHDRPEELLLKGAHRPVYDFMEYLVGKLDLFRKSAPLNDDLTMAAIKYAAEPEFTTPDGVKWVSYSGTWYADGNVIVGRSGHEGYLVCMQEHPDDMRISATLRSTEGSHLSLWFAGSRARVEHDGYFVGVRGSNADLQRIGRKVCVVEGRHIRKQKNHTLIVERQGGTIRVFLDRNRKPLLQYDDPEPLRGEGHRRWGFYVWDGEMQVLNWKVEALPAANG